MARVGGAPDSSPHAAPAAALPLFEFAHARRAAVPLAAAVSFLDASLLASARQAVCFFSTKQRKILTVTWPGAPAHSAAADEAGVCQPDAWVGCDQLPFARVCTPALESEHGPAGGSDASPAKQEEVVEAAFAVAKDVDPELLKAVRAPEVSSYAAKQGVEPLLSLLLQKLLIEQPGNPAQYLHDTLEEWTPRMVAILGPPATGKYTLAGYVADRLALEHVSPGDLVEGMIASDTLIGGEMKRYVARGDPVPDELIEPVVLARLRERDCRDKGWVLDGWPRTQEQAQRLVDERVAPQIAVRLLAPDTVIEDRVSFRLENPATGRVYHQMTDPPPLGEGRKCVTRAGETGAEVEERLALFRARIGPVLQRLAQTDGFRQLEWDVSDTPLDMYRQLGERLARRVGV